MTAISGIRIPDFAGVALVDILANGVATLIIIIAISISARIEQEDAVLDQVNETAVVLSREFSDKLIINKLSGNAPARLHDYDNSPLDQYLDIKTMPIFELHRDMVRNYFSGAIYTRSELLQQKTRLDDLLSNFNPYQQQRLRVDVYDVQQFYVFMSILRAHNISIRHWHFLKGNGLSVANAGACPGGIAAKDCANGLFGTGIADANQQLAQSQKDAGVLSDLLKDLQGTAGSSTGEQTGAGGSSGGSSGASALEKALSGNGGGRQAQSAPNSLPSGTDLRGFSTGPNSDRYAGNQAVPYADASNNGEQLASDSDKWHRNILRGMGRSSGMHGQGAEARPNSARMRLASPDTVYEKRDSRQQNFSRQHAVTRNASTMQDLRTVLSVLMEYCRDIQSKVDNGTSPWSLLSRFRSNLSKRISQPKTLSPKDEALILPLIDEFNAYWPDETPLTVTTHRSNEIQGLALAVPINQGVQAARIMGDEWQTLPDNLADERRVTINLNLHPSISSGVTQELQRYGVLLMPTKQRFVNEFRWRALVYIAPAFDDFVLGFLYSAISSEGELLLHPESNNVAINGQGLRTAYPPSSIGTYGWIRLLYTGLLIALLLLLWPVVRLWFSARRTNNSNTKLA